MKRVRKLIAFALVTVILTSFFVTPTLANMQSAVSDFTIVCSDAEQTNPTNTYNLQMTIKRPIKSSASANDGSVKPADPHNIFEYQVFYRNATLGTGYPNQPFVTKKVDPVLPETEVEPVTNLYESATLDPGSLYLFKTEPVHYHLFLDQNDNPSYRPAPKDPTTVTKEVIFLTDIRVKATGSGKNLTVTWDAPTLGNRELFQGYNIYYKKTTDTSLGAWSNEVYVPNEDSEKIAGNKRQYTFTAQNLEIGTFYDVKVEPVYSGKTLFRDLKKVTVGTGASAIEYNLAYPPKAREYKSPEVYIKPALRLEPTGDELLLSWDKIDSHLNPEKVLVEKQEPGTDLWINIGSIIGPNAIANMNYWHTQRPKSTTYYRIRVIYKIGSQTAEMESEIAIYNPSLFDFYPYRPNIFSVTDNVTAENAPLAMEVTWKAFTRMPYDENEEKAAIRGYYIDKDIFYDIWVTDKLTNFEGANPLGDTEISETLDAKDLQEEIYDPDQWSYKTNLTKYATKLPDGSYVMKPLEDNKVYYIKIIARRAISETQFVYSQPAFRAHYIQPKEDLFLEPSVIAKPPLRIKQDPPGVDVITDNSITVQWDTRWFEVYDGTEKWYTQVGVDNGKLVFGANTENLPSSKVINLYDPKYISGNFTDPNTQRSAIAAIKADLVALGYGDTDTNLLAFRMIDLGNAQYEIHVEQYDTYLANYSTKPDPGDVNTYKAYLDTLDDTQWTKISPSGAVPTLEFEVKQQHKPTAGGLEPNTPYIIFLRPFVTKADNKKYAYYPSFVVGTTLDVLPPLDITPTVPILEAVSSTETSITVRWKKSAELDYELGYDELLQNYPEGGTKFFYEEREEKEENGVVYYYCTIHDLFPQTLHYIWIRSSVTVDETEKISDWSNPVSMTTKIINPPSPPKGLGLAAMDNLKAYNKENSTELYPVDSDYMIIEWMKDVKDIPPVDEEPGGGAGAAPGPGGNAATEVLESDYFKNFILVKFNELTPNKSYYVRAKTMLTVARKKEGPGITKTYNYVVQVSPNADFADAIEVTVPQAEDIDPANAIRLESDWTATLIFQTGKWNGEYDGDININTYPLPWEDYEIIYNPVTDTMTYRFRSNKTDANGNRDNMVDQRFITRLVADKVFEYSLDLTYYNGRKVTNRELVLPYTIVRALDERKIALRLRADTLQVSFPAGSLKTNSPDFGMNGNMTFRFAQTDTTIPLLSLEEIYTASPQKLSITVNTPSRNISLSTLSAPATIEEKPDNRHAGYQKNISTYFADVNSGGWKAMPSQYDQANGTMTYKTAAVGAYAVIARDLPQAFPGAPAINQMQNVTSKFNITDMNSYQPNTPVHASQFNKIIFAVANGKLSVAANEPMTQQEFSSMGASGMLISGTNVPREAGINALVKLYEKKTGRPVKSFATQSKFGDLNSANANYRNAILKAEAIGFMDGEGSIRAKENMTFAQLFKMLDIVIADAGL